MKYNIIICSLPYSVLDFPAAAPPVLKGICEAAGFKVYTRDLAVDLYKQLNQDKGNFFCIQDWLLSTELEIPRELSNWLDFCAEYLIEFPADYIGLSVFSEWNQAAAWLLADKIKRINPNKKIVMGGRGLTTKSYPTTINKFNILKKDMHVHFWKVVKQQKLADYLLLGDAEESLVKFLRNNGLDHNDKTWGETNQILNYPFPNFDDYNLNDYIGVDNERDVQLPIISSKGCVRDCDFCDVAAQMPVFKWKPAKDLYNEIIYLSNKYNHYDFTFVDSILNGNVRQLKETVNLLAKHNRNTDQPIEWGGNWICRPISQMLNKDFYKLLAESGCKSLTIGVEHGSDRVLTAMNKKTSSAAFWHELKYFNKYNIQVIVNLITGHWSETWEDFIIQCEFIVRLQRYVANGTVSSLCLGEGFTLLDNTPALRQDNLLTHSTHWQRLFYSTRNPDLGFRERAYRTLIICFLVERINGVKYRINLQKFLDWIISAFDDIKEFQQTIPYTGKKLPEQETFKNINSFMQKIIEKEYKQFSLKLKLKSENGRTGSPQIHIMFNGNTLFNNTLAEGIHELTFPLKYNYTNKNQLEILFTNKQDSDTIIDNDGNILKDKKVEIIEFIMDDIDIAHHYLFVESAVKYYEGDKLVSGHYMGFWQPNSRMVVTFKDSIPIEAIINRKFLLNYQKKTNEARPWSREVDKIVNLLDQLEAD